MNHLHNAVRKCSHQYERNWGGYLLPKEILALRDLGVSIAQNYIDVAVDWKQNGVSGGRWTYFDLNDNCEKKFKILKEGLHR
jgi:hypothetical protein